MSNNDDFWGVDQQSASALNQGMSLDGGIELPFAAPLFWWMNGSAQSRALASVSPALYYGGWACDSALLDDVLDDRGGLPNGMGLVKTDIYTRNNKTISAYTTRMLVVAPISYRSGWIVGGEGSQVHQAGFTPGGRQHIQVLALLGSKRDNNTFESWGPVVLSAKGYQAGYLTSAMKDWKKAIERVRREVAPQVPAWAFYMAVGTIGDAFNSAVVGKGGATSPITPINLFVPKTIDDGLLRRLYVGREAFNTEMVDLLDQAKEWLGAWKNGSGAPNGDDNGAPMYDPSLSGPQDEDIPF